MPTAPGAASGRTWLGQTKPQLPCEHASAETALVHDRDLPAVPAEVVGTGGTNDAAADHDHPPAASHTRIPSRSGSSGSSSSVASAHDMGGAGNERDDAPALRADDP